MGKLKFGITNSEDDENINEEFRHADGDLDQLLMEQEDYIFDLGPVTEMEDDGAEEEDDYGVEDVVRDVENAMNRAIEAVNEQRLVHTPPSEILMNNHFMVEFPESNIPYNQVRGYKFEVTGRRQEMTIHMINTNEYQISLEDARNVAQIKLSLIRPDHDPIKVTNYQVSELTNFIQLGDYNDGGLSIVELSYIVSEIID